MTRGNTIVTTGTASGKSLCFNLPVLHMLSCDPRARALYLYPAKALAQDQARRLSELRTPALRHAIYDGDTPREERTAIRRRSNLVLTNPDMLHVGILPHHDNWGDFLANLALVVVDEAHIYRGVFGSHVGERAAQAAPDRARLRDGAALRADVGDDREPAGAGGEPDRPRLRADRSRRRAAQRPRDRDVQSAAARRAHRPARVEPVARRPACSPT